MSAKRRPRPQQYLPGRAVSVRVFDSALQHSRFAVVTPRSAARTAVERNLIKRAIWETIRRRAAHNKPGRDIIIAVHPRPTEKPQSFGQVRRDKIRVAELQKETEQILTAVH